MKLTSISLFEVKITTNKIDDLLIFTSEYLGETRLKTPLIITTPNPEQLVVAQKDGEFKRILNKAEIGLPDGVGIVWAIRQLQGDKSVSRISGIDFMEKLVVLATEKNYPIGFIGGRDKVGQKALDLLKLRYPSLTGWAKASPEFEIKNNQLLAQNGSSLQNYFQEILQQAEKYRTKIIFVGLGAPKQEYFMAKLKSAIQSSKLKTPIVLMSVGGAFDMLSGKNKRAPKLWQYLRIEWLWRLILEPWRLKRQLRLIKFVFLTFRARFVLK